MVSVTLVSDFNIPARFCFLRHIAIEVPKRFLRKLFGQSGSDPFVFIILRADLLGN